MYVRMWNGFDWDAGNVEHIRLHDVLPEEVEQAAMGRVVFGPVRFQAGEARRPLYGKTLAGRYLTVVFTLRNGRFRAVTAYRMKRKDRNLYGPQID